MTFDVKSAYYSIIEEAIIGEPRSQQRMIGPSEIGAACLHCLAAKLAGWEEVPEAAWLPYIGTAVHEKLEKVFQPVDGWLTETRVSVGRINGVEVRGTSDLFHIPTGTVIDHKIVGATTLRTAKKGPSAVYRSQAHLYGLGFLRAGLDVNTVAISYLPRNAIALRMGVWWSEPFNPTLALDALDRATNLVQGIESLPDEEERNAYISSLPRADGCFNCPPLRGLQAPRQEGGSGKPGVHPGRLGVNQQEPESKEQEP